MSADEKLSAAQRSKIRRLSAPKELAPDEEGGELNIVPFLDIVTNVLMFVLATVSVTFTATIDTFPPRAGGAGRPPTTPTLGLTILVVPDGFSLKARGGNVAPGCNDMGPGLAVPRASGGAYDYAALATCAARLRGAKPEFETDDSVIVTANPEVTFESLVAALDAVRATSDGRAMFTKVQFAVPR